jgi:WD40 repeat protein
MLIVTPTLLVANNTAEAQLYPAWSPTARERVAFSWQRRLWCYQVWNDSLVDAGPNVDSLSFEACLYPDWSGNGTTLSFVNSAGLHTLNVVTQQVETLVSAAEGGNTPMQCWSPNGNQLLFLDQGLMILDYVDRTVEEFAATGWNDATIKRFCWSPQGYYLAVGLSGGGSGDVLEIRHVSTKDLVRSHAVPSSRDKIEWSPDGEWISLGFSDSSAFALLNAVSGEVINGRLDGFTGCGWPTWSRSGDRLAFHAVGPGRGSLQEIWTLPVL